MKRLGKMYLITITVLSSLSFEIRCNKIQAEISYGELVDKITILTIKSRRITNRDKLQNVKTELASLQETFDEYIGDRADIATLQTELQKINEILWDVEDLIRIKELNKDFGDEFVQLARNVYFTNDKRAAIKREIDVLLGSRVMEEKSYQTYA